MKTLALPLAALVCLVLSGCGPNSVHPLYTSDDAVVEPALEGTWIEAGKEDESEFNLQKSGAHEYTLAISSPDNKFVQNYEVNFVRLGDQLYMDMEFKDQAIDGAKLDLPLGAFPAHVIVKLRVAGDDLAYATLDKGEIDKQNQWDSLPLAFVDTDGATLISAPTADLRHYISVHADDVFSDFEHLTRKRDTPQP